MSKIRFQEAYEKLPPEMRPYTPLADRHYKVDKAATGFALRMALMGEYEANPPFCPLIKSVCDTRCVCFFKGLLYATSDNPSQNETPVDWWVIPPGCGNAMFDGGPAEECRYP